VAVGEVFFKLKKGDPDRFTLARLVLISLASLKALSVASEDASLIGGLWESSQLK